MTKDNPWTIEEDATLKELYCEGYSSRQISDRLGRTRNAVVGRWDRLGLNGSALKDLRWNSTQAVTRRSNGMSKTQQDAKANNDRPVWHRTPDDEKQEPYIPKLDPVAAPMMIGIMELTSKTCRWPYGTENFLYCGCRTEPGRVYCPEHARRAWSGHR